MLPDHPDIRASDLFSADLQTPRGPSGEIDGSEGWCILHPYDIPGVRQPTASTPPNLRRLAENEDLVESVQTMEYLTRVPEMGSRRDFCRFPPRYGDPYYRYRPQPREDTERGRGRGAPPIRDRNADGAPGHPPLPPTGRGTTGGGFMSPLRRVMETAERVFKADYQPSPPVGTGVPLSPSPDELECFVDPPSISPTPAGTPKTTDNTRTGPSQRQTPIEREGMPRPAGYRDGTPRWVDELLESDSSSRPSTTTSHTIPGVVIPQPMVTTPQRGLEIPTVGGVAKVPIPTPSMAHVEPAVTRTSPQHEVTSPV